MTPVTSRANDLGNSLHMPTEFEIQCGIGSSFNEQVFHNAAARLELNGNIQIAIERTATNNPTPWTTLADNLDDTKDMFPFCHGATDGSLVLEHYIFATGNGAGLKFNLAKKAQISLNIYDIRGSRFASIIHGESLNEGEHSMIWDGKGNGQPVASGTYFARIQTGALSETVKFAFVK